MHTDHGVFVFTLGPDRPQAPTEHDATWYAYTWLLGWIEGSSHREMFAPRNDLPRQPLMDRPPLRVSPGRVWHRSFGRTPTIASRPHVRRASSRITPHPVCSHLHRHPNNPQYVAPEALQKAAAEALIQIPLGYTFIRTHWSPARFSPSSDHPQWIPIAWSPHTAMHTWRTIVGEVSPSIPDLSPEA